MFESCFTVLEESAVAVQQSARLSMQGVLKSLHSQGTSLDGSAAVDWPEHHPKHNAYSCIALLCDKWQSEWRSRFSHNYSRQPATKAQ
jgi:hypothetical protein